MFVVVNVLVIVQIRINSNHHQYVTQKSEIITVVLNVIAVALVKCAFRKYLCRYNQYDMVDVLNHSGQSKRTNNSSHCRGNLFYSFKCPVLNFVNFSCAATPTTTTPSATVVQPYDCLSHKSFIIPKEQQISHRTNILSLSTILFPVSTERQLVIIFCNEHRKDFVTHNNIKMNNIVPMDTDAMVKYSNNNTIYNLNLFISTTTNNNNNYNYRLNIFTILYLVPYDFKLILNLINFYVAFSVKSYYGKLIRTLFHNFRLIYMSSTKNAKCWTHKMCTALKNSMIFAL